MGLAAGMAAQDGPFCVSREQREKLPMFGAADTIRILMSAGKKDNYPDLQTLQHQQISMAGRRWLYYEFSMLPADGKKAAVATVWQRAAAPNTRKHQADTSYLKGPFFMVRLTQKEALELFRPAVVLANKAKLDALRAQEQTQQRAFVQAENACNGYRENSKKAWDELLKTLTAETAKPQIWRDLVENEQTLNIKMQAYMGSKDPALGREVADLTARRTQLISTLPHFEKPKLEAFQETSKANTGGQESCFDAAELSKALAETRKQIAALQNAE